jgi:hypothetical protein
MAFLQGLDDGAHHISPEGQFPGVHVLGDQTPPNFGRREEDARGFNFDRRTSASQAVRF